MDEPESEDASSPERLKKARKAAGLTQQEAAALARVDPQTISRWERGERHPSHGEAAYLLDVYRRQEEGELPRQYVPRETSGARRVREPSSEPGWSPNPALKKAIPPRAYEVAIAYCRRLAAAGLPPDEIDSLERVMIDSRYAKANSRKGRELSEDDWILLVDDAWDAIREALASQGVRV